MGVIAAGETIESLAGIMGGAATAVSLETTDIYLEAAFWFPEAIAGRARRYKFSSEASHRFERGVDFQSIPEHIDYISSLILEICGGQAGPVSDQTLALPARLPVNMRLARCRRVLGIPVSADDVRDVFTKLNFSFTEQDDVFSVTPPSFRFDLEIEEDLIEEVARIYGFERIPGNPPSAPAVMLQTNETRRSEHDLRHLMAALDYQEVVNFSFVEKAWEMNYMGNADPIGLLNPIASQLEVMRSGLIGGLIANIQYNQKRQQSRVRVFELGRVFRRDPSVTDGDLSVAGVRQPLHLAAAAWGPAEPEQWGLPVRQTDFFDVKNDIERLCSQQAQNLRFEAVVHPALHPGRSANVLVGEQVIGFVGELHPQWVQDNELVHPPVLFELDVTALQQMHFPNYQEVSRQPAVFRDLAVWAPSQLNVQDLLDTVRNNQQDGQFLDIIKDIALFDVWKDPKSDSQERSLALRFTLQDPSATLEDTRVDQCMNAVLTLLVEKHGVRKR